MLNERLTTKTTKRKKDGRKTLKLNIRNISTKCRRDDNTSCTTGSMIRSTSQSRTDVSHRRERSKGSLKRIRKWYSFLIKFEKFGVKFPPPTKVKSQGLTSKFVNRSDIMRWCTPCEDLRSQ